MRDGDVASARRSSGRGGPGSIRGRSRRTGPRPTTAASVAGDDEGRIPRRNESGHDRSWRRPAAPWSPSGDQAGAEDPSPAAAYRWSKAEISARMHHLLERNSTPGGRHRRARACSPDHDRRERHRGGKRGKDQRVTPIQADYRQSRGARGRGVIGNGPPTAGAAMYVESHSQRRGFGTDAGPARPTLPTPGKSPTSESRQLSEGESADLT